MRGWKNSQFHASRGSLTSGTPPFRDLSLAPLHDPKFFVTGCLDEQRKPLPKSLRARRPEASTKRGILGVRPLQGKGCSEGLGAERVEAELHPRKRTETGMGMERGREAWCPRQPGTQAQLAGLRQEDSPALHTAGRGSGVSQGPPWRMAGHLARALCFSGGVGITVK